MDLVYQHGIDEFYKKLSEIGVNSVLIADLPPEEADDVILASKKYGVEEVFIVSQATSNERLADITKIVSGFIYIASVMGTTGARKEVEHDSTELIKRVREHTNLPLCVGFGISKPEHVKEVLDAGSDGAIVGSAILNIIEDNLDNEDVMFGKIAEYIQEMKSATKKE